jgi:propionyl-CoA carboxylase alpha chain
LRDILAEESYVKGETNTSYLPRVYPNGFSLPKLSVKDFEILQGVASVLEASRCIRLSQPERNWDFVITDQDDKATVVNVAQSPKGDSFTVTLNEREIIIPSWDLTKSTVPMEIDGQKLILQILGRGRGPVWKLGFQGASYDFKLLTNYTYSLMDIMPPAKSGESAKELHSPMPGVVRAVAVKAGDKVFKGQEVCVIEAMKMQNKLVIGADGIVAEVRVKEGDTVSEEDLLIQLK